MVVSQDLGLRRSLAFILDAEGFRVVGFANLDLARISGMAERSLCAIVEEIAPGHAGDLLDLGPVPVIVLGDEPASGRQPAGRHYLRKPIIGVKLVRLVNRILSRRRRLG